MLLVGEGAHIWPQPNNFFTSVVSNERCNGTDAYLGWLASSAGLIPSLRGLEDVCRTIISSVN